MRTFLLLLVVACTFSAGAQTATLPVGIVDYMHRENLGLYSHSFIPTSNKKWSVNTYSGITTGFSFFNGGTATMVAAPVGLQLNRRLNDNLYAFAGVSVAPTYINFGNTIGSPLFKGSSANGMYNPNSLSVYSRAELGLMYINDARTFSVSGSVGVSRSSGYYPGMPVRQTNPGSTQFPSSHKYQ
ncbi:MAG: hypothetical protein QM764_05795 [Chitinophagaceae bacterium]